MRTVYTVATVYARYFCMAIKKIKVDCVDTSLTPSRLWLLKLRKIRNWFISGLMRI